MIAFFLYKLGSAIARVLPLSLTYLFAAGIADLNFLINFRSRRAVVANLQRVCPQPPERNRIPRIARHVFHNFAFNIVDFLRLPGMERGDLERVIVVEGLAHFQSALARGHGVILLSAHIGNWEYGGAWLAQSGIQVKAVALPHGAGRVTRFFDERRRAKGIDVLPLTGSTFAMLECLHAGGVIGLIADRDYAGQGLFTPFFGESTMMPRAHASLALKTGATVVPAFCLRTARGRFRLIVRPPVAATDLEGLDPEERVSTLVDRCARELEWIIRRHPEQWFVFVPLWPRERSSAARTQRPGPATGAT